MPREPFAVLCRTSQQGATTVVQAMHPISFACFNASSVMMSPRWNGWDLQPETSPKPCQHS